MSCNVFGTIWVHRRTWRVWTFGTALVNALKLFLIVPLTWWLMILSQKRSTVLIDVPQGIVAIQYHSLCGHPGEVHSPIHDLENHISPMYNNMQMRCRS